MKNKSFIFILSLFGFLLPSCNNSKNGKIYFDLEGGSFLDDSFSTDYLVGEAGTPITEEIPNPHKDGYYFVGWREKDKNGAYRVINKKLSEDGNSYYYYPYGTDTFYAYFEPLTTIEFDLTQGSEKGKLIPPKREAENFQANKLNGYSSKKIISTDYLPTCDGSSMHLNFLYWYCEYPLTLAKDENDVEHYFLDTSKEKGIYRFDQAFSKGNMEFILSSTLTLYAYWTSDPTITIHTNIEKLEDYSFQANTNVENELTSFMKVTFSIDLSVEATAYYMTFEEKKYRFAGFFLNPELTQPFALNSQIYTEDFSLYMKWDKQITVTFDFNGGTVSNQSQAIIHDYFSQDILPLSLYEEMIPTKGNCRFSNYTLNGNPFIFGKDRLPKNDITLIANYTQYPTLTLSYDYPNEYRKEKLPDETYFVEENQDFTGYLNNFKLNITEEELFCDYFYTLNSDGQKIKLDFSNMPQKDTTIYLSLNYLTKINVRTILQDTIDESLDSTFYATNNILSENDISQEEIIRENDTYLFDYVYLSDTLEEKIVFPYHCASSHDSLITLTLYKKMTKAINLTFVNEKGEIQFTMKVIPGSKLSRYQNEITNKIGQEKYKLKIKTQYLFNYLPDEDSTITIEF